MDKTDPIVILRYFDANVLYQNEPNSAIRRIMDKCINYTIFDSFIIEHRGVCITSSHSGTIVCTPDKLLEDFTERVGVYGKQYADPDLQSGKVAAGILAGQRHYQDDILYELLIITQTPDNNYYQAMYVSVSPFVERRWFGFKTKRKLSVDYKFIYKVMIVDRD